MGLATGLVLLVLDHDSHPPLEALGHVVSLTLLGAAMGLMLWASAYRYRIWSVWGRTTSWMTIGLIALLGGTSISLFCLLGACGER